MLPCTPSAVERSWRKDSTPHRSQRASRGRIALPYIPPRPPELDHLTDEAASAALASHYGNFRLAARELGVDAKLLRRLFWHNPRIMETSKERAELFHRWLSGNLFLSLIAGATGISSRGCGVGDYPTIRPVPGLGKELTKDIKKGKPRGRHARKPAPPNVDLVVEREVELRVELERERAVSEVMVDRRMPAPARGPEAPRGQPGGGWPTWVRRPSRGGWR